MSDILPQNEIDKLKAAASYAGGENAEMDAYYRADSLTQEEIDELLSEPSYTEEEKAEFAARSEGRKRRLKALQTSMGRELKRADGDNYPVSYYVVYDFRAGMTEAELEEAYNKAKRGGEDFRYMELPPRPSAEKLLGGKVDLDTLKPEYLAKAQEEARSARDSMRNELRNNPEEHLKRLEFLEAINDTKIAATDAVRAKVR